MEMALHFNDIFSQLEEQKNTQTKYTLAIDALNGIV